MIILIWLPGFIGPVPPPLLIRNRFYYFVIILLIKALFVNNFLKIDENFF